MHVHWVVCKSVDGVDDVLPVDDTSMASVSVLLRLILWVKVIDGDSALNRARGPT
jgi:hypothetical protein